MARKVKICIPRKQFAEEFLDGCIDAARTHYGLTEKMVKDLIRDMGYCRKR